MNPAPRLSPQTGWQLRHGHNQPVLYTIQVKLSPNDSASAFIFVGNNSGSFIRSVSPLSASFGEKNSAPLYAPTMAANLSMAFVTLLNHSTSLQLPNASMRGNATYWLVPLAILFGLGAFEISATHLAFRKNEAESFFGEWSRWMPRVIHNTFYAFSGLKMLQEGSITVSVHLWDMTSSSVN
jgi:hypothetical protein